jgi:hypothetical protein
MRIRFTIDFVDRMAHFERLFGFLGEPTQPPSPDVMSRNGRAAWSEVILEDVEDRRNGAFAVDQFRTTNEVKLGFQVGFRPVQLPDLQISHAIVPGVHFQELKGIVVGIGCGYGISVISEKKAGDAHAGADLQDSGAAIQVHFQKMTR